MQYHTNFHLQPAPEANPHPLAAPQGEICPPAGAQVMSCSFCRYGFNPATCKPGATGTECSCNVCNNICTKDTKKREAEADPEPQVYDKICGNFCFDDEVEVEHSKREAEPEALPQTTDDETCSPKDAPIESCSKCPNGFGDACTKSVPPICTCNGCGNKCVDDEEVSDRSVAARVPPPEDICPAPGASCSMCMAGGPERCEGEVEADGKQKCYCRFCPDEYFCYA